MTGGLKRSSPRARHRPSLFIMQPEISRRCSACGAAVRANATFCHQCGKPMMKSAPPGVGTTIEGPGEERAPVTDAGPENSSAARQGDGAGRTAPTAAPEKERAEDNGIGATVGATAEPSAEAATGDAAGRNRLNRARAVARGAVEERLAPRVEKLRQTSSVVLDEAADDPSVRFLLVAAALFVLFLVLLIITKLLE